MNHKNSRPIAILLAAYNAEKYLGEQLDSLLNQTNQEWTLYIRNDGSTDSTQQIIDEYIDRNAGRIVQVDKGGENLGCRGNFLRLLEVVESDYYMFCDADDYWVSDKTELSINLIREKEQIYKNMPLLVFGDNSVCDEKMNVVVDSWWRSQKIKPEYFTTDLCVAICNVVGGATCLFNHKVKSYCFPIPQNPPLHDVWIPMQVAKYGKIFVINKPLKFYRQHGANEVGASTEPYKFKWNKLTQIFAILKRDYQLARYFKGIGYGSISKYYLGRVVVLFKLQWGKITYK